MMGTPQTSLQERPRLRHERFGDGVDPAGLDVQPAAACLEREAMEHRAVALQDRRLQLVQSGDDLDERQRHGQEVTGGPRSREGAAEGPGDVRRVGRGDDRGHAGNLGELRIAEPVPDLETNDGQRSRSPTLPSRRRTRLVGRSSHPRRRRGTRRRGTRRRPDRSRWFSHTARPSRRSVTMSSKLSMRSDLVITGSVSTSSTVTSSRSIAASRSRCQADRADATPRRARRARSCSAASSAGDHEIRSRCCSRRSSASATWRNRSVFVPCHRRRLTLAVRRPGARIDEG